MGKHYKNEIFNKKKNIENTVKDMVFCHLQPNFVMIMDTATKTGIHAAKTVSKRFIQKTAEATGDLIGNKMAGKITSAS